MKAFLRAAIALFAAVGESLNAALFTYMQRAGLALSVVPTAADFAAGRVTNPAQSEVIRQRLYDYLLYPAAGQTQLNFFSQPAGQGLTSALGAAAGSAKTQWDTNLVLPNQLPSGKAFMVESIEVDFMPGSVTTANTYTPNVVKFFAAAAALTVGA